VVYVTDTLGESFFLPVQELKEIFLIIVTAVRFYAANIWENCFLTSVGTQKNIAK
jgi:hypothetical protein